jgi:CHAD domain-containing protein
VKTVFRHLRGALSGDEESVHQVRVAGRRLRVALPLLARKPRGGRVRQAERELRELVRTAGKGRDLDVILPLFDERLAGSGARPGELAALRRRLRAARTRSRSHLAEGVLDLDLAGLRANLRRILNRGADGLPVVAARLRAWRDKQATAIEAALRELDGAFDPKLLHRVRRSVRRLRYAAEIAAILGAPSETVERLKELQDLLGRIQDAHVLSAWLGAAAARAERKPEQAALAAEARRQQTWFVEQSRRHHQELLRRDPIALLRKAIEAMDLPSAKPQQANPGAGGGSAAAGRGGPAGPSDRGVRSAAPAAGGGLVS